MVRIILSTGTPVNRLQFLNESVLQSAMRANDLTILRLLLEAGANTEANAIKGAAGSAVGSAAKSGCIEIVKLLLDHGVTIDPPPVCVSAKLGDEELLNYLIPGASKDQLNLAMQEAINSGHTNLVRILLDSGADPNCKLPRGSFLDTPLIRLFRRLYFGSSTPKESHVDIVEMLISRGADATFSSQTTAFHLACLVGPRFTKDINWPYETTREDPEYKLLDLFLSAGMNINGPDPYGDTPVHLAVRHLVYSPTPIGYLEYFISRGADVNTVNMEGRTPLHKAASSRKDVFMRLIELGADLSISDPSWDAPMVNVAGWGALWPDVLKWYLQRRRGGLGFNGISETALLNASRNAGLRGELGVSKILLAGVNPG
ncbi:ankyrin repeat-containing domain protein [Tuber brumale]|nr:ankyrin repeat-containing domain protein [Tuber brumale]